MRKTVLNTAAKTMRVASGWMSDHAQPRMLERYLVAKSRLANAQMRARWE
jgi:hypothetical protein